MDANIICVATLSRYLLVNSDTSKVLDLFPIDREQDTALISRIENVGPRATAVS